MYVLLQNGIYSFFNKSYYPRRISQSYIDSLNEIHKKRVAYLEEMYEKRISELLSQLQEDDSSTEESSMSINKGNSTLDVEVSDLIFIQHLDKSQ